LTTNSEPKLITIPTLFGTLFIVLIGVLEHAGINPFMPVYTVQLGLAVISLLFFYIAIGLNFGGILPLGRDSVFEVIHDGIILLDPQNRIVDLNPPAEQYISQNRKAAIKKDISDIWPQTDRLIRESPLENVIKGEFDLTIDGIEFIYEITITRFIGLNNITMGRLVLLRNITDRERMENTLIFQSQTIARTNILLRELTEANLHIQESNDIQSIFLALGAHFRKLKLECYVTLIDPESSQLRVDYLSSQPKAIAQIEKLLGFQVMGYRLKPTDFPQLYSYLESDASDYFSSFIQGDVSSGDLGFKSILDQALSLIGIDSETPLMVIHLKAGGKTLGLIGIWGKELQQEDFDPLRIFAGQVAMAIERTKLYEKEVARVNELSRSNQLISALANVSAQMGTSPDSAKALETLGEELERVGLHCLLGTVNDTGDIVTFQYVSFLNRITKLSEKVPGFNIIGYKLPKKLWPGNTVVREGVPAWYRNPIGIFSKMFPSVPEIIFIQAMKKIDITPGDSLCILPLVVEGKVTGVLPIWGRGIEEKDTSTLMIFAHQVAEILRKTKDFEVESIRANSLARTNAMIIALSNVATRLETTSNMAEVFDTLGKELRNVKINCMVGTLEENKQVLKIEYISISQDLYKWAEKTRCSLAR
jgi:PAS domain S-box-containing protein